MLETLRPHIKPFQKPHPPIGVAGVSKGSDTLKLAGERGFWPMSLNLNPTYVGSHWESVEKGAARSGRTPKRSDWRLVREVFVADTDAEAMRLSVGGMMGRMMREYFLPLLAVVPVHRVPQARARRAGLRRHARVLRQAQLAGRLAGDGGRAAARDLRARSAASARCCCSASTTPTTRRPGATRWSCWRTRSCRSSRAWSRSDRRLSNTKGAEVGALRDPRSEREATTGSSAASTR